MGIATALFTPGCPAVAVDAAFRTYIAGATTSTDFPGVNGFQTCLDSPPNPTNPSPCPTGLTNSDVFVARLNASGNALDYVTYLGGSGADVPAGIAVDQNFNVHVAGTTNSANFPTSGITSFQATPVSAGTHVFVTEVASTGATLNYSTYLSGNGTDVATGIAVDSLGKEYVERHHDFTGVSHQRWIPHYSHSLADYPQGCESIFLQQIGSNYHRTRRPGLFDLYWRQHAEQWDDAGRRNRS